MKPIRIWYVSNEYDILTRSVMTMADYDWVDSIVILNTKLKHTGTLQNLHNKVREFYADFGEGFDKSISQGGFNEVSARNLAINLAKDKFDGWLVQCDSDEFYLNNLKHFIEDAELRNLQCINIACYHYRDKETYCYDKGSQFDRHVRIWRSGLTIKYYQNPNTNFMSNFANESTHCIAKPVLNSLQIDDICHIHVHDLFQHKRRIPNADSVLKTQPIKWPKAYKELV